ncbi:Cof-type HAD-IIB family hydrolase [Bacillus lacus]|uniref:Cof-type HAD-IIB family hydrolase n=1 Tax=Metabacillus lacus TaxID=1983721 RepID=A0A7X2LXN3_9BACI|nr:Cof-type HAD-IIB family hydrolase [Metabacillus lacus]MRX71481.1 Cof-type HAD-IIB family hydrolase [Metabacillus lacus]
MNYRLLALNIDGTLLHSNGRLHQSARDAIYFVQQKGVYITLITNRHFQSAKKLAKSLKLESFLITSGGAFIANKQDEPIFDHKISEDKTFNLIQVLENFDCSIKIVNEKLTIGNKKKVSSNLLGKAVVQPQEPLFYPVQFVDSLADTLMDDPVSASKIDVVFSNEQALTEVYEIIKNAFEGIDLHSHERGTLRISSKGVNKAAGLRILAGKLGIPLSQTVAIGDSLDDLEMISIAGLGVAMGQAPFEVKHAADWLTRSNDDNGLAYMIKEHFRMQQRSEFLNKLKIKR